MAGYYSDEERAKLKRKTRTASHWLGTRPGDPETGSPEGVSAESGVWLTAFRYPVPDPNFPPGSPSARIGKAHDEDSRSMHDRRLADCPFSSSHCYAATTPAGIAWAALIPRIYDTPGVPIRQIWKEIRQIELFMAELKDVRVADRRKHPGLQGGASELRTTSSHDVAYDGNNPGHGGLSTQWGVIRKATAEQNAAVTVLAGREPTSGTDVIFAVRPCATLNQSENLNFTYLGTLSDWPLFREMMRTKSTAKRPAPLWKEHAGPIVVGSLRRLMNSAFRFVRPPFDALRAVFTIPPPNWPRRVIEYFDAWFGLLTHPAKMAPDDVGRLLGVLGFLSVIAYKLVV